MSDNFAITIPTLPTGYYARAAELHDAEDILKIFHAVSLKMVGEIEETLDDITGEWEDPEFDLAKNTRVVFAPDGRLTGYAILYDIGSREVPTLDAYTHPDDWERDTWTMPYLLAWLTARARENIALVPPEVRVALRAWTHQNDTWYQEQLVNAGLQLIRHAFRMQINFEGENATIPQAQALPQGFRLQTLERDADWKAILEVIREAWRDHFGYIEQPFDEHFARWSRDWEEKFTPGLWLAAMAQEPDGEVIAGVCLCKPSQHGDEQYGWVSTLAVRRAYRRQGLASSLLQNAFATLHQLGKTRVGLGVDASSLTGATRVYERAGMFVAVRISLYERELRPGIDTTISNPI